MEVGEEGEYIPITYTVTTRMTCIQMGSDESYFNVSLVVRDKVTRPCPQTTTFFKRNGSRSGIEPRSFRLPAYRLTARPNRLSIDHHFFRSLLLSPPLPLNMPVRGLYGHGKGSYGHGLTHTLPVPAQCGHGQGVSALTG